MLLGRKVVCLYEKCTHLLAQQAMWTEVTRRAPGARFKPKLPGRFWLKPKSLQAKQLKTKSTAHGWSSSEGKVRRLSSEAKTCGLFFASQKSMHCLEQAIWTEVPKTALGAKAPITFISIGCRLKTRHCKLWRQTAKKSSRKRVRQILFGA